MILYLSVPRVDHNYSSSRRRRPPFDMTTPGAVIVRPVQMPNIAVTYKLSIYVRKAAAMVVIRKCLGLTHISGGIKRKVEYLTTVLLSHNAAL